MGICSSKKAVAVKEDFSKLNVSERSQKKEESRFEKVKIHAKNKNDPKAVVDEDIPSNNEYDEEEYDEESGEEEYDDEVAGNSEESNSVIMDEEEEVFEE